MDAEGTRPTALGWLADLPPLVLAAGIAVLLGRTFAARVAYPYDLEWMEGGMLVHALRVARGQPLYVEPSWDFIPCIYPPLYTWVVAALSQVFELGYPLGRSVSLAGTLLAAAALVAAVRGERGSWAVALATAGLFFTGYDEAGSFYDLVRIDGLFAGLVTWSLVAVRHGWLRAGGLLLVAAYATKHNAAALGVPVVAWLWRTQGARPALRFTLWSVLPALAFTGAMQLEGDGLFLTYIVGVPSRHPYTFQRFVPGTPKELFLAMPWTLTAAMAMAALSWRRRDAAAGFWLASGGTAVLLSAIMRAHHGGYVNVLVPALWTISLWSGLAVAAAQRRWPAIGVRAATGALLAFQIWAGRWDPGRYVPTPADREAGDRVLARIAAVEGEVLAPWSPWYPVLVGKEPSLHLIALWDIDHKGGPLRKRVRGLVAEAKTAPWAAVVSADEKLKWGLGDGYERTDRIEFSGKAFYPKVGWRVRPRYVWRPKGG